jgi:hypothetical protein
MTKPNPKENNTKRHFFRSQRGAFRETCTTQANIQQRGNMPEQQECPAIQPTEIPGVARTTKMGDAPPTGTVQAYSHSERLLHPIHSVGRSGGKPHDKLIGNGADSDDDFIPATSTAQATTISHDSPSNFIESSHTTQQHRLTAGVCWKKLMQGLVC